MTKPFKFLDYKKPIFQYEITNHLEWFPASLHSYESWSGRYSEIIKEWLSEYFFNEGFNGEFQMEKYFPEIDRTCKIIQTGLDFTPFGEKLFTAIVQIKRDDACFLQVHVNYPISMVIYR